MAIGIRDVQVYEVNDLTLNGSITAILPTTMAYGDVVLCSYFGSGSTGNHVPPSGWNTALAVTAVPDASLIAVYWKTHTVESPISTPPSVGYANAARHSVICQAYSGVNQTSPFNIAIGVATQAATTSISAPSITTTVANTLLVSGGLLDSSSAVITKPASMTLDGDVSGGSVGRGGACAYEAKAAAGSTGVRTWTGATALGMAAYLGALAPQVGVTFTGSCTSTGVLRRVISKSFAGSSTAAGAWSYIKVVERVLTASITAAGAFAKRANKAFAGSSTAAGLLIKRTIKGAFTGSVTAAGSYSKSLVRIFAGSITAYSAVAFTNLGRAAGKVGVAVLRVVKASEAYLRRRIN